MLIEVSNQLTVSNPTDELILWCKKNLTLSNPKYSRKVRMNLWAGNTPPKISLYETRGKELVLPYGCLSLIPHDILNQAFILKEFAPSDEVDYHADIPLYDYQETAVQAMIDNGNGILQSAAGSGKTQMGIALTARLKRRTLWLCHTLDLIKQSKERAKLYMSEDLIGTITEGKVNLGTGITFATIQTMSKLNLSQYRNYWDVIITDEVHRVSGSPTAVTQYQKVLNSLCARHKYGLSATVHRSDGMIIATKALVGDVAYKVPDEAVADKIMKVGIYPVCTDVGMSDTALNSDGTINYTKLITYLTEHSKRNQLIVMNIYMDERPSLILSDRLSHLETLMKLLPKHMQDEAVMISGKMTSKKGKAEREQAIEDMRTGKKKYLFATYSLAKEGLDIPRLERLYMTTPQKDYAVVTQAIGRIARTCEGKKTPICYDFVDGNIGYLARSYKKRCTIYRKGGCYFT